MRVVIKQKNKTLNDITLLHYGSLEFLDAVIESNAHLLSKVILDLGDEVELPQFEKKHKSTTLKALWD
jgi:hypothetical protein